MPVIVHELEYYEAIARQTEAANPPGLADEFTSWVRNGCCIRTVPIPDSTVTRAADPGRGRLNHRNGTGREAAGGTGPMRWNLRLTAAKKGIWKASELQRSLELLRVDRQLVEALTHGPDPLHLAEVFGLDEKTAMRYADSARRLLETSVEPLSAVTASVDDQC
ncbi:hypothetical protein [Streptomyces griseoviridis]|uniref:hypothetical protein n=1 Tax=Streptomyces griseoviridis TaxID=45398 RepID=UPI0034447957